MQRHYFPSQITFPQGLTSDQRLRLHRVIATALRAVIQASAEDPHLAHTATAEVQSVREYFAANKVKSGRSTAPQV